MTNRLTTVPAEMAGGINFLYRIDDDNCDERLVARYARFKLGDPRCRSQFLTELSWMVSQHLPVLAHDSRQWIIVTPATTELAQEFAITLANRLHAGVQIPVVAVGPDPHPDSDYTNCSADQRQQIVESFYDFDTNLVGKKVLVIDDFVNTGTALAALTRRLVVAGAKIRDIHSYVFVKGCFPNPTHEATLVTNVIAQLSFDDIIRIVCDPGHYITSATMLKYLAGRSKRELQLLATTMTEDRLSVLRSNTANYYRKHPLPDVLKSAFFDKS